MEQEYAELSPSLLRLEQLLDEAGDQSMLLAELDGFLCCLAVGPEPIASSEWWPFDWLTDERGVLRSGSEEIATLIEARLDEINAELAADAYAPLFEVDEDSDDIIWEVWIAGFQQAMLLRFEAWDDLLRDTESDIRGEAAMGLASAHRPNCSPAPPVAQAELKSRFQAAISGSRAAIRALVRLCCGAAKRLCGAPSSTIFPFSITSTLTSAISTAAPIVIRFCSCSCVGCLCWGVWVYV